MHSHYFFIISHNLTCSTRISQAAEPYSRQQFHQITVCKEVFEYKMKTLLIFDGKGKKKKKKNTKALQDGK